MVLDIKPILIDQFTKLYENIIWLVPIVLVVALSLFLFRHEVADDLMLTRREKNRLTEKSLLFIMSIAGATIAYLYIKEYFLLLSVTLSVILTYFLYSVGILDMIIEWWEDRYGR